jgi:hypothetical protein
LNLNEGGWLIFGIGASPSAGSDLTEIPAFDIDDSATANAFHLRVRAQPADAFPRLIGAAGAKDTDLIILR